MITWIFAAAITVIACAALYFAANGRAARALVAGNEAVSSHFRQQLQEIEADIGSGRLGSAEGLAAKSELAREVMRVEAEAKPTAPPGQGLLPILLPLAAVIVLAGGTYAYLGNPNLPSEPLAGRTAENTEIDLPSAIQTIEAQLAQSPDDLRGWQVIAPVYRQMERYDDLAKAMRRIYELSPVTTETETDLGEALMLAAGGQFGDEAMKLFRSAVTHDATNIRAKFYIAAGEMQAGDFKSAADHWNALIAEAKGDEPWLESAKAALAQAEAGLNPQTSSMPPSEPTSPEAAPGDIPDASQIEAMVDGLEARLRSSGGTIEEWTRLVRSRMVQGRIADAQADYDLARTAYPDASVRTELDVLAADNGLVAKDAQ